MSDAPSYSFGVSVALERDSAAAADYRKRNTRAPSDFDSPLPLYSHVCRGGSMPMLIALGHTCPYCKEVVQA